MAKYIDISDTIERLELFEEKLGVRFEALSAAYESTTLFVYGELHPKDGTTLKENITLVVTVYDSSGRMIGLTEERFRKSRFFGFEAFSIWVRVLAASPAKVRVYPKKASY